MSVTAFLFLVFVAAVLAGAVLVGLVLAMQVTTIRSGSQGDPRCPVCGIRDVRRSVQHTFMDRIYSLFGCKPYRCRNCGLRFHRYDRVEMDTPEAGDMAARFAPSERTLPYGRVSDSSR